MSQKHLVPGKGFSAQKATRIVPYLAPEEVYQIADACGGRNKERDSLLVLTLFQTGLRISEALDITPRKIGAYNGHSVLYIKGKIKSPGLLPALINSLTGLNLMPLTENSAWTTGFLG